MSLTSQVRDRLLAHVPSVHSRIYPDVLPLESKLPAIVYQRIASTPFNTTDPEPPGLARTRIQFSCWARDYSGAQEIASALYGALGGWRDQSLPLRIDGAWVDMDMDDWEPDSQRFRRIVDVMVMHQVDSAGS